MGMDFTKKIKYIPIFLKTLPWYTKIVSSEIKKNIYFIKAFIKNKQNNTNIVKINSYNKVLTTLKYRHAFFKKISVRPEDITKLKYYKPHRLYKKNIFYYKSNYEHCKDTSNVLIYYLDFKNISKF